MFENITGKFQDALRKLTGKGQLSEKNMRDALGEIRMALLDADVNYKIVTGFMDEVTQLCLGQDVLKSVTPGQQTIKIVNDKLTELMGTASVPLQLDGKPPVVMMLCGLHGSGKTTTCAKLASFLHKKHKKRVMLAACDLHRPAAIDQLEILGKELGMPVYAERNTHQVTAVAQNAMNEAIRKNCDVLLLDTAGRLQIDAELVQELVDVRNLVKPAEILLVGDAALGQEAVSVAEHFDRALGITGIILTKLDGDARGGAALSMRQTTGKPIKFVTVGERIMDLEVFHPDRMASRILGMGDVVSLVEKAAEQYKEEEAEELAEKMRNCTFGFDDFHAQIKKMRSMGGLMSLLKFIPGMPEIPADAINDDDFKQIEGMIHSMTPAERRVPELINASRRRRIAKGCGITDTDVTRIIKQFMEARTLMSGLSNGKISPQSLDRMLAGSGGNAPPMPGFPTMPGQPPAPIRTEDKQRLAADKARKAARKKMADKSRKANRHK